MIYTSIKAEQQKVKKFAKLGKETPCGFEFKWQKAIIRHRKVD